MHPQTDSGPMADRFLGSRPPTYQNAPISTRSRVARLRPSAHLTIVRTGGLGDTILVLPTLEILRAAYPDATLTLVGSAWADALQPLVPLDVRVLHFDHAFPAAYCGGSATGRGANVSAASDVVIVYTATPESDFVVHVRRTCQGPVVVWPLAPAAGIHASRHLADAVAGAPTDLDALPTPTLQCPDDLRRQGRGWLDREFGQDVRPVALHPGAGGQRKCWPAQQFAELAARLEAPVLLIEGPADAEVCREFARVIAPSVRVVRAAGVSLPRLAALLSESRGYVGNDSGVSHLAAALGVPTIAVFGPTDAAVWAPRGPEVSIVTPRDDAPWPTVDDALVVARTLLDDGAAGAGV